MKPYPAVEVTWKDAHGGDAGWTSVNRDHGRPAKIRTVGMLAQRSKAGLVIVLSLDKGSDLFGAYVFIPHRNIIKIKGLS